MQHAVILYLLKTLDTLYDFFTFLFTRLIAQFRSYPAPRSVGIRMFTKIFGIFALIGVWCFPAHARTIPFGNKEQRQADLHQIHPVLGVGGLGKDTIHPRLEIRELERNKDQFNVYLLGLQRLQNIPQDDKLSYYRISGKNRRSHTGCDTFTLASF